MAKGGAAPRPGGQAKPVAVQAKAKVDVDAVKNDVKAFASKLGLAPGGTGDDVFEDFAPEKAKQRIGAGAGKADKVKRDKKAKKEAQGDVAEEGAAKGNKRRRDDKGGQTAAKGAGGAAAKDGKGKDDKQQQHKQQLDPKITERQWNTGVGPRPGECNSCVAWCWAQQQ